MPSEIVETFEALRPNLLGLGYRITGSQAEAEDIVQESFLKWLDADHAVIKSPRAWLMKAVSRLSLDYLKSAKVQRVSYIGPWLPAPFLADKRRTPEEEAELDDSVSMALLVLLERLSADERAAFILHDLFHFDFREIGQILDKTGAACRQLASRARKKIGRDPVRAKKDKGEHLRMLAAFFGAVKNGDVTGLVSLLKENAAFHPDGGGKAPASMEILRGAATIASFLLDKVRPDFLLVDAKRMAMTKTWFNGSPGLVLWRGERPVTAFSLELERGAIKTIYALRNPDKLRLFGAKKRPISQ